MSAKRTTPDKSDDAGLDETMATRDDAPSGERNDDLDQRMSDLAAREAALEERERNFELQARERESTRGESRSRAKDDTRFKARLSMEYYTPPNQLEVPYDPEYHYRWVAEWVNGTQTPRAVQERLREGYIRVMQADLPEDFLVDEDTFGDGYARTTGLILMRIPLERKEMRDRYYAKLSGERLNSANELQGVAGRDSVKEDRGSRSLTGAEAGRAIHQMSSN